LYCDGIEACDAVLDCQPGSDPCLPTQTCDEDGDVCVDPPCEAVGVGSCRDHLAAGWLCLDLATNGDIDPRLGGISEVEIDLLGAAGFAGGVTVNCSIAGDVSANVSGTTVNGNTVTVTFDPALPDQDACVVDLDCGASVCVRGLEGDMDGNGATSTADALTIKVRFGLPVDASNAGFDFNVSGDITTSDYLQVKPRFGITAPACP
jgi:hypothetical protein